jgi:hypothetical protein
MPRPNEGEKKSMFVGRAISEFRHEGIPEKQAVGRAYGYWKTYGKGEKKKSIFKK